MNTNVPLFLVTQGTLLPQSQFHVAIATSNAGRGWLAPLSKSCWVTVGTVQCTSLSGSEGTLKGPEVSLWLPS